MRKRAQRKTIIAEPKHAATKGIPERKSIATKKNWWIAVLLIGIFFLVLLLNTYFNFSSGFAVNPDGEPLSERFYLSGPDPYYNMRLVETTLETGHYPFYSTKDPLLNYPLTVTGRRAPLLNMFAIGFSRLLVPFINEIDAVGYSMQFVPALFGALIIFPVYFIGKTLFGKKAGVIGALLVAIIPLHISSGHGSAYALFDHDSFNLLMFFLTFLFLIKGIKERETKRSIVYALLAGLFVAALTMTWVEARFIYAVIAVYAIVQMIIDIVTDKIEQRVARTLAIILLAGYCISLPVMMSKVNFGPDQPLFMTLGVVVFSVFYVFLGKKRIPWVISLPAIFCAAGVGLIFLYYINIISSYLPFLSPFKKIAVLFYGTGIYGTKVSETVAEAGTYTISRTVMSYGPVLYWLAWFGLILLLYFYVKEKRRRDYLFIIVLFLVEAWLAGTAGRFLNDSVPLIAILGGWIIWVMIDKIQYKQMLRNIRNAGGGLRGLKRGVKALHLSGILFVAFLVILPNAFLALDAAVPSVPTKNGTSSMKVDYFGKEHEQAFGSGLYKEQYWIDALAWLNDQDAHIEDPTERPAFISWWDYGFYEAAAGGHPTVADNFQTGIPPASNFHTATSEKEAVAVMIVRLLEGDLRDNNGMLSEDAITSLEKHVGVNETANITKWLQNPESSPSFNAPIGEQYDEKLSERWRVGEQYEENAFYHDVTEILNNTLDEEEITWLYHDIQNITGYSIRYYGVEGYDMDIFNIFGFLSDKSIFLPATKAIQFLPFTPEFLNYNPEDDFIKTMFTVESKKDANGNPYFPGLDEKQVSFDEIKALSKEEQEGIYITDLNTERKDDFFKTMFYRTYVGDIPEQLQNQLPQLPCWGMKHFYAEFVSDATKYPYRMGQGAVVIAKYYEGAIINGSVEFMDDPLQAQVVVQKNILLYGDLFPVDHDKSDGTTSTFRLLAPAGNITLQIRRYPELGVNSFVIKAVTFNNTNDSAFAPITDDEAMRLEGTPYEREVNITVDPGNITGYVYKNNDDNESYNMSSDEPLANVDITILEIDEFDPETGQPTGTGAVNKLATDEMGHYTLSNLLPGIYFVQAVLDDFAIYEKLELISAGNNSINISKPKPSAVEGKVYFDADEDAKYDPGEEMSNIDVNLLYPKLDGTKKLVDSITTDQTGDYAFSSLIPGNYIINATKLNSATGYADYAIEETVSLPENETTTFNVSIGYAPITVSGYTKHDGENIGDIAVTFLPDASIKNNTAQQVQVATDESGSYTTKLLPGYYNVSVKQYEATGNFTFAGQLFLKMGEGVKSFDIPMTKHSVTVTGKTLHNGTPVANITIDFLLRPEIENNTAEDREDIKTDENGAYTVELMPGSYDVAGGERTQENGQNVTYTFEGQLEIRSSDITRSFDIVLTRTIQP